MTMNGECLFNAIVPIYVKNVTGGASSGSQFGMAVAAPDIGKRVDGINIGIFYTSTSPLGRRTLEVRLTDNNDPFFYWLCSVSEEEFFMLKREQNLLVDYNRFAYKLIELLQQCLTIGNPLDQVAPQFMTSFSIGAEGCGSLAISESTSFKQLTHLSLRFNAANDQTMKKHLSDAFSQYKNELNMLRNQAPSFRPVDQNVPTRRIDMSKPSIPPSSLPPTPSMMFGKGPEDTIRCLESQNQQLLGQKLALENELNEIRRRYNIPAAPIRTYNTNSAYEPMLSAEINKANEIIRKLQDEVKSLRNRARTAEASAKQLERISRETGPSYEAMRIEVQELKTSLAEKTKLLAEAQAGVNKLSSELEDTKKVVEANEKVIEWLHQQINEDPPSRFTSSGILKTGSTAYRYASGPILPRLSPDTLFGKGKLPDITQPQSSSGASTV